MPILTPLERIGTRVADKYELTSMLGRGGMGVVYQAVHRWTGRRVAVKLIEPTLADDPDVGARFLNEARAAAAIAHPHVVDVLDMGRDEDGTVYQALELLEGETLSERMRREPPLEPGELVRLLVPVMDALAHAHRAGIVHRDVKPGNVFLRRGAGGQSEAVLLDFGMAKLLDGQPVTTRSSAVLGTPHYMAPEQALGAASVGPAADLWAVGAILFEGLSGKLPFGVGPPAAYLARVVYEDAPALHTLAPHVSEALCAVVDRALAREPDRRQPSMSALIDELVAAVPGLTKPEALTVRTQVPQPTSARSVPASVTAAPPRARRRLSWLAVAALCTCLTGLALWLIRERAQVATAAEASPAPPSAAEAEAREPAKSTAKPALSEAPRPAEQASPAVPEPEKPEVARPRRPPTRRKPAPPQDLPRPQEELPRGMTSEW